MANRATVKPIDALREARKIGRELREEFRAGGEFTQTAFREELARRLQHLNEGAYDALVDKVAEEVDRASTHDRISDQMDLPGFDMEGEYRCGNNIRVAKRLALYEHAQRALMLDDQNLVNVQRANLRKREELMKLAPYWRPDVTKEQAVREYESASPQADDE